MTRLLRSSPLFRTVFLFWILCALAGSPSAWQTLSSWQALSSPLSGTVFAVLQQSDMPPCVLVPTPLTVEGIAVQGRQSSLQSGNVLSSSQEGRPSLQPLPKHGRDSGPGGATSAMLAQVPAVPPAPVLRPTVWDSHRDSARPSPATHQLFSRPPPSLNA